MTHPLAARLSVPFVSWDEVEERHREEVNPSLAATFGMIMSYWGRDPHELDCFEKDGPADWVFEGKEGTSVENFKPLIADGIPVPIGPTALTPFAHPTNPLTYSLLKPDPVFDHVTSGNLLGFFIPLPSFMDPKKPGNIREDQWWSGRVVVGYDDRRGTILLPDPTFGPYWEVTAATFDRMWEAGGRAYTLLHPLDYKERASTALAADPIVRHPSRIATERFVFGYALSQLGRNDEAEIALREGLAVSGADEGIQFLLLNELGVVCHKRGDLEEALICARRALRLLPRHHASYYLLGNTYRAAGAPFRSWWYGIKARWLHHAREGSERLPQYLLYSPEVV